MLLEIVVENTVRTPCPRACPHRTLPVTIVHSTAGMQSDRRIRCKFKGCVTKSLLCVRSKGKGASRAARAQCAYPVLSAKRRHQLHHVGHRVGSAEHLRQHRQSARGQHEGSAAVGPLRLVRAARQDALAHGTCGMRIPWLASMVQGPDGPREMRGDSPHASVESCASLLKGIPLLVQHLID